MNRCARIEENSTNGRKQETWDDVTKCFPFHKTAVSTNPLGALEHWNVKYAIKVNKTSSTYIVSALLCLNICIMIVKIIT